MKKRLIFLLTLIVSILSLCAGCSKNLSEDTTKIAELDASVVKLNCYDMWGNLISTGSGFIAIDGQTIFTNYHVIDEAYTIELVTNNNMKVSVPYIIADSETCDVAVLRTETDTNLKPLTFGSSTELEKGEKVVAIGSPEGFQNIVSIGNYGGTTYIEDNTRIQFTAPISHGSSGGALFNEKAELIGITYASYVDGQNLNFAVRAEDAMKVYNNSKKNNTKISKFCSEHYSYVATVEKWEKENGELPQLVTQSELQKNPKKYNEQYLVLCGYIASINHMRNFSRAYFTSDITYVNNDYDTDKDYFDNISFQKSPYMQITQFFDENVLLNVKYGDYVMMIGRFSFSTAAEMYAEASPELKDLVRKTDMGSFFPYKLIILD